MSLINPKTVEWDCQWFNYVTSVPMKFWNCYLLDDGIPTPENVPDAKTHKCGNDLTGLPPGSKLYQMWNNENDTRIISLPTLDHLTPSQLRKCLDKHVENIKNIRWTTPLSRIGKSRMQGPFELQKLLLSRNHQMWLRAMSHVIGFLGHCRQLDGKVEEHRKSI